MRRFAWAVGFSGLLALGAGCGKQVGSNVTGGASSAIASNQAANLADEPALRSDAALSFSDPVAGLNSLPQGTVPDSLIVKTDPLRRLPQVRVGRSNPFASLAVNPTVVAVPTVSSSIGSVPAAPQILPSPVTDTATAPNLPLSPQSLPNSPLPAIPVAPTGAVSPVPVAPPPSLAQQIRVSGAIQVGDRLSIIVEVPNEHTSRSVSVGDYVGNGSVLVKRIEMRGSQEPRVVFEENGVDVVREVGDVSPLMSSL